MKSESKVEHDISELAGLSALFSNPLGSVLTGMQSDSAHTVGLPGLLGPDLSAVVEDHEPLDWRRVVAELEKVLPAEVLEQFSEASPAKLCEVAIRECPGCLLALPPDALDAVRIARLSSVIAAASYRSGDARKIDAKRLRGLWSSEPARDALFPPSIVAAVYGLSDAHMHGAPSKLAGAIIRTPEFSEVLAGNTWRRE